MSIEEFFCDYKAQRYIVYSGLYYKSFMIIIYDRNDSSLYYKTMITIASFAPKSLC
jgi:hypothetical protein